MGSTTAMVAVMSGRLSVSVAVVLVFKGRAAQVVGGTLTSEAA